MKFIYSTFIENSPDMREWLEKIGYRKNSLIKEHEFWDNEQCIVTDRRGIYLPVKIENILIEGTISCLGNPELFKAVSAVRDDSDFMQLFTDGVHWCKCYFPIFSHFAFHQKVEASIDLLVNWHKADLTELQKRFKK